MSDPAYDRELIARMLDEHANEERPSHTAGAIREQANLLRAADNADAAGVRTINTTVPVRALPDEWRERAAREGTAKSAGWYAAQLEAALAQQPEVQQCDEYLAALDDLYKHCDCDNNHWLYKLFLKFVDTAKVKPEAPAQEAVAVGGECSFNCMSTMSCDNSCAPQPAIPEGWVLVQRRDAQCLIDNAPDCSHVLLAARRVRDLLRPTQEPDHG